MLERIITALVLVAVVLSCMFATQSHYPMFMLMILAAGVAGYDWYQHWHCFLMILPYCFGLHPFLPG